MASEPRVLHLVPCLFSRRDGLIGGAERYAFELARYMAREVPTSLVAFGDEERQEVVEGLNIHVIGRSFYVGGQRTNGVAPALVREVLKADVVHCHQRHVVASSLAALICRLSGRQAFVTDLGGGGRDISAYVSTERWYRGHLHVSGYSRRVYGQEGKPWAHVIYGGVDTDRFSPGEVEGREATVLFVGRLLPHKGVDDLVRGLPEGMQLEVIGPASDGRYLSDLKALANGGSVVFRHDCDDDELVSAYRRALCVVLPSVFRTMYGKETALPELLGQTLLEGMACGVPVICTDVAGMPEVVQDGVTGFVVPPNDPGRIRARLLWLLEHPAERHAMGEAGRRRVLETFTWPAVVRRCLELYSRCA